MYIKTANQNSRTHRGRRKKPVCYYHPTHSCDLNVSDWSTNYEIIF